MNNADSGPSGAPTFDYFNVSNGGPIPGNSIPVPLYPTYCVAPGETIDLTLTVNYDVGSDTFGNHQVLVVIDNVPAASATGRDPNENLVVTYRGTNTGTEDQEFLIAFVSDTGVTIPANEMQFGFKIYEDATVVDSYEECV